jgi:hypothetical protein
MGARLGNGSPPTDAGNPAVAGDNQQNISHARMHRRKNKIEVISGTQVNRKKTMESVH